MDSPASRLFASSSSAARDDPWIASSGAPYLASSTEAALERSGTARHLAAKGWKVYTTAPGAESIDDLRAAGCETLALEVTDERPTADAVAAVERAEGAVGVLVKPPATARAAAVEEVPLEHVRRQFETNVVGLMRMCQVVLPDMRRQGWRRIVSLSGKLTFPGGGFYHATKHAVEGSSDALRFEVAGFASASW
ncbi:MAG: SDR family NAD(P)-dependent oxidoreductase [Solirubrobacteraceae bacterium]